MVREAWNNSTNCSIYQIIPICLYFGDICLISIHIPFDELRRGDAGMSGEAEVSGVTVLIEGRKTQHIFPHAGAELKV